MTSDAPMTYEEYQEQVTYAIMGFFGSQDGDLEKLQAEYPDYAARAKVEADTRRGCTQEEYDARREQQDLEEAKETTGLITDQKHEVGDIVRNGKYQYRVTEASFYVSAKEAAEVNEAFDANDEAGWHTKVEFVKAMTYWQVVMRFQGQLGAENYEAETAQEAVDVIMSMQIPGTEFVHVTTVDAAMEEYKRTGKKIGE